MSVSHSARQHRSCGHAPLNGSDLLHAEDRSRRSEVPGIRGSDVLGYDIATELGGLVLFGQSAHGHGMPVPSCTPAELRAGRVSMPASVGQIHRRLDGGVAPVTASYSERGGRARGYRCRAAGPARRGLGRPSPRHSTVAQVTMKGARVKKGAWPGILTRLMRPPPSAACGTSGGGRAHLPFAPAARGPAWEASEGLPASYWRVIGAPAPLLGALTALLAETGGQTPQQQRRLQLLVVDVRGSRAAPRDSKEPARGGRRSWKGARSENWMPARRTTGPKSARRLRLDRTRAPRNLGRRRNVRHGAHGRRTRLPRTAIDATRRAVSKENDIRLSWHGARLSFAAAGPVCGG